jgi:surface polysaccharide O-acyltransferase-like enzyme
VPLFFFANGYLLFRKEFVLREHILKIIRLSVLTLIWAIITLLLLQPIKQETLSLTEFIKAIWNWKQGWINHLWYMGSLICIYIFFPLLKTAYDNNYKTFLYFTIICAALTVGNTFLNQIGTLFISLFLEKSFVFDGINFFNIFNPFRGIRGYSFVYFCLGGIAYLSENNIEKIDAKKRNTISIVGLFVSCLGLFYVGCRYSQVTGSIWDVVWNGYDSLFTLANVVFIYVLCLNWKKNLTLIRLISTNTLGIYFIHGVLLAFFKPQIRSFAFSSNLLFNLIYAVFILLLSLSICTILKKIPFASKLFK